MSKVICAKMGIGDCSLVADIEHLQSELSQSQKEFEGMKICFTSAQDTLNEIKAENKRLKEILEKERVVQRRIHQIFRHLSNQVELGWESCLHSFGMGESGITHDKDGNLVPSPSKG